MYIIDSHLPVTVIMIVIIISILYTRPVAGAVLICCAQLGFVAPPIPIPILLPLLCCCCNCSVRDNLFWDEFVPKLSATLLYCLYHHLFSKKSSADKLGAQGREGLELYLLFQAPMVLVLPQQ